MILAFAFIGWTRARYYREAAADIEFVEDAWEWDAVLAVLRQQAATV